MKRLLRTLTIFLLLLSNIGCDQFSKNLVRNSMIDYQQISVVEDFLTLIKVENTGAFLSMGSDLPDPFRTLLLTFLPVVVLAAAVAYLFTSRNLTNTTVLSICFIVGGGIGNIYDRARFGSVTDFLHMDFGIFQTGIFNMADVSIMCGILLFAIESFVKMSRARQSADLPEEN